MKKTMYALALALSAAAANAATPLVTQYIAPVTNMTWEGRVATAAYGTGEGFEYTLWSLTYDYAKVENYNLPVADGGTNVNCLAFSRWVSFRHNPLFDAPGKWTRSVLSEGAPCPRYLYPAAYKPNGAVDVGDAYVHDVDAAALDLDREALAVEGSINTAAGAVYAQCVHTDWVYTVTYDANGGTGSMPGETYTNAATVAANAFTRTGAEFRNWNTEADGSGESYAPGDGISADLKLYAIWLGNSYDVTLEHNNMTGDTTEIEIAYGAAAGSVKVAKPSYRGHTFGGYWTAVDGGEMYFGADGKLAREWDFAEAKTLYARWTANTYHVEFSPAVDDATGEMANQTFTWDVEQYLTKNAFARTGYEFVHWTYWSTLTSESKTLDDGALAVNLTPNAGETVKLSAVWRLASYEVSFDAGGEADDPDPAVVTYGDPYGKLPSPEPRDFWRGLVGWFTAEDGGDEVTAETLVTTPSNHVLYAHWQDVPFEVTFKANGGGFAETGTGTMTTNLYLVGEPYGWLPTPTNSADLVFAGWWSPAPGEEDAAQVVAADAARTEPRTFTARWKKVIEPDTCEVVFLSPDAECAATTNEYAVGSELGEFPVAPAHTNAAYRLFGWYLPNGSRATETTVVDGPVTLTAKWTVGAFNDALGCDNLVFWTDGAREWQEWDSYAKVFVDHASEPWSAVSDWDFAQSGAFPGLDDAKVYHSGLYASADRPGVISFAWDVDSNVDGLAFLSFGLDGFLNGPFCGEVGDEDVQEVEAGEKMQWLYQRDYYWAGEMGEDRARLTSVSFEPDPVASPLDGWESLVAVTSAVPGTAFSTGGSAEWTADTNDFSIAFVRNLADARTAWIKFTFDGPGVLSLEARADCEPGYKDEVGDYVFCDRFEACLDGAVVASIDGRNAGFRAMRIPNKDDGPHVYMLRYVKDASRAEGEDAAWLRNLKWTPGMPEDPALTVAATPYDGVYDGAEHGIEVSVAEPGAAVKYAAAEAGPYSAEPILFRDVTGGEKAVWYVAELGGYVSVTGMSSVTVSAKALTAGMVSLSPAEFEYDGSAKEPAVEVVDGEPSIIGAGDWSAAFSGNVDAGEAQATVTAKGNYTGEVVKTFTIAKAANAWTAGPSIAGWTEGEEPSAPVAAAKYGEVAVTYSSGGATPPAAAGDYEATFTVEEAGNWKGLEATVAFTVKAKPDDPPGPPGPPDPPEPPPAEDGLWPNDGAYNPLVANVYDGYVLNEDGSLAATLQVKASKQKVQTVTDAATKEKTVVTNVAVTAVVKDPAGKSWNYSKGVGTADGVVTGLVCTKSGAAVESFGVRLGANGMTGDWGGLPVKGARNGMGVKGDAMKAALEAHYMKSWSAAFADGAGVTRLQLLVKAKGAVKVSGTTVDGFKASGGAQGIMGEKCMQVPYLVTLKKGRVARPVNLLVTLSPDGAMTADSSSLGKLSAGGATSDDVTVAGYVETASPRVGVKYSGAVKIADLAYPAKFSARKLPSGLKIDSATGEIKGTPTKAGDYTATIIVTSGINSKSKASFETGFTVAALDAWAQGAFNGAVFGDGDAVVGLVPSLSVSKAGKFSGKIQDGGVKWTLSATSYDSYDAARGEYAATVIAKNGKVLVTNEVTVAAEDVEAPGGADAAGGGARSPRGVATAAEWAAWQNLWKTEPWKTAAKPFAKAPQAETADGVSLKFTSNGSVKAKYAGNSCSTVLIPVGEGGRGEAIAPGHGDEYETFVHFPPKAGGFGGYSAAIPLRWNGSEFVQGGAQ